jgi:hypothetical protein
VVLADVDVRVLGRRAYPLLCTVKTDGRADIYFVQVVFGTVVTRGPRSPLAQSAMTELEQACILFSKASVHSIRAAKALVRLFL